MISSVSDTVPRIRIGISACLLGERVRFDGGHKRDRFITGTLGKYFDWVPVCPEVELGLGTPRETMRLVQLGSDSRLLTTQTAIDLTEAMRKFARRRVRALRAEGISAYILKSDSPSCGRERVRLHVPGGKPVRRGQGLFAEALLERFPHMPLVEEQALRDPCMRENWLERVFAYRRLQLLWRSRWSVRRLTEFHTAHKVALLAHAPQAYRALGRLVARAEGMSKSRLRETYESGFMRALEVIATRGRHVNALRHMAGFFKKDLDDKARDELDERIADYRRGTAPRAVPLNLIRRHIGALDVSYLKIQTYLDPYPRELAGAADFPH